MHINHDEFNSQKLKLQVKTVVAVKTSVDKYYFNEYRTEK